MEKEVKWQGITKPCSKITVWKIYFGQYEKVLNYYNSFTDKDFKHI